MMDTSRTEALPEQAPRRDEILAASRRIAPVVHRTPLLRSSAIDEIVGGRILFKCENLQKVGAFKARGALNHVLAATDAEVASGVVTHSSGNHAQALALAARVRTVAAYIVMPKTAPKVKVAAVRGYGAKIVFCEPTIRARETEADRVIAETGAHFVHPYNDPLIIAGQATATLEIIEDAANAGMPEPQLMVAPVGGGGLLSGTALAARYFGDGGRRRRLEVWGAEPRGAADAHRSLAEGRIVPSVDPRTVADGLLTSLGSLTFPIIRSSVAGIGLCSESSIARAMRLLMERMKLVVEPSGAVGLASLLEGTIPARGRRIVVIISGGNIDPGRIPSVLSLEEAGG